MISYKLAKSLKDARFPLIEILKEALPHSQGDQSFCLMCGFPFLGIDGKFYMQPVLDVLIEACGEGVFILMKNDNLGDGWSAALNGVARSGGTPEIAVANLYLALHAK